MAEQKPKESLPKWGKKWVAQIGQVELIIKGIGNLLTSIQNIIFSLKKLWLGLGGPSILLYIDEKVDWQTLSAVIN